MRSDRPVEFGIIGLSKIGFGLILQLALVFLDDRQRDLDLVDFRIGVAHARSDAACAFAVRVVAALLGEAATVPGVFAAVAAADAEVEPASPRCVAGASSSSQSG